MKDMKTNMQKEDEDEYENENENEDGDDDETMNQNEITKEKNDLLDEIIDKSKSFEDQIESLQKVENLEEYYFTNDFDDKELKYNIFELKLVRLSNIIDKKLFGHTLIKLADKLINATNKEENQIIVNSINKNKDKFLEINNFNDWVIQPIDQHINLIVAINLILDFNEHQLDLV